MILWWTLATGFTLLHYAPNGLPPLLPEQGVHATWWSRWLHPSTPLPLWQRLPQKNFDIPMQQHPLVDAYVAYFTGRGRSHFVRWLNNLAQYRALVLPILRAHGLPEDLMYLAMIESGFNPRAHSRQHAVGMWQIMPQTGVDLGLESSAWIDERRDVVASTQAAARFLKQLYRDSHYNWHLAWAYYNAGKRRIVQAEQRYNLHDYWQLAKIPQSMPLETRHYVPKTIAAAMIVHNLAYFGFEPLVEQRPAAAKLIEVSVPGGIPLATIAAATGMSFPQFLQLNTKLLRWQTPPQRRTRVRILQQGWTSQARQKIANAAVKRIPKRFAAVAKASLRASSVNKLQLQSVQ